MSKKDNRIFVTDNPLAQSSIKRDVLGAFDKCGKLETLIKDFGLPLTRDIVTDCLTLSKETERVPAERTTKWVGEKADAERFSNEFKPVEVWRNNEHLKAAFEKMLLEVQGERVADINQRKETLKSGFDNLLEDIYGVFHIGNLVVDTNHLLRYFDIKNDSIVLAGDFDERLKADTATYATKEEAKDACKLHREIALQLNKLGDLMKNVPRSEFAAELDKLFFLSEDDAIQATPIDYDLFT